ncbi:MAG TPA: DUF459 domain-containing protein [Frankiaceae bacterium]|nr:DUF459 domain-containing protein [Frankiaceae bacterium]
MTDVSDRPIAAVDPDEPALAGAMAPGRTLPAGKVLVVMLVAFVLAALFNSKRFVHAAETMELGWQRTALLAVAKPVDSVAEFLHTDRPRGAVDRALGRDTAEENEGAFEPDESVLPTASPLPSVGPSGSAAPSASASPPAAVAFRDASPAAPLSVFVTGDSMIEFLGPRLIKEGEAGGALRGGSETKYGTGLVRDDVLAWPVQAREQMAKHDPEAVVVMMGGNDGQGFTLKGGRVVREGTPEWKAEYQRRAAITMRAFGEDGKRHVYWVGMPIAKSNRLTGIYREINAALAAAAASVPRVTYVDIWNDFAVDGRYADFVGGELVRARDGIHLNREGSTRLMRKLYAILDKDWRLST